MSDEETEEPKLKGKWALIAKLLVAVGTLSGFVERYVDLAEKNALVYEALSSKVNSMSEELARVKGQNEMLMIMLRNGAGDYEDESIEDAPAYGGAGGGGAVGGMGLVESLGDPEDIEEVEASAEATSVMPMVEADLPEKPSKKSKRSFNIGAYQQLPGGLEDLVQQKQDGKFLEME